MSAVWGDPLRLSRGCVVSDCDRCEQLESIVAALLRAMDDCDWISLAWAVREARDALPPDLRQQQRRPRRARRVTEPTGEPVRVVESGVHARAAQPDWLRAEVIA